MARSNLGPRVASLCWATQQASKVATVSQITTPQEGRGLIWVCAWRHCAGPPSWPRKWRRFHRSHPPAGKTGGGRQEAGGRREEG
eukprot:2174970-Pyramimonas_sp.AAC.1